MTDTAETPSSTPIDRRTLHAELVERLRSLIVEGSLPPGAKVNETALCERFGVSRTPLREALRSLGSEGLVIHTPRRGATVAPLTLAGLEEVFPILGALEALAGELACARITDAQIARAAALQSRMAAEHAAGDLQGYFRTNGEIHALILAAADNPSLTATLRSLDARVRRARFMANMSPDRWAQAVTEHEAILAALAARDGARLGQELRRHLANKFASLRQRLSLSGRVS